MRQSTHIDRRQAANIRDGLAFAAEIGRAPNRWVTLQFAHTDCDPEAVSTAFQRLLRRRYTPWLRPSRNGGPDLRPAVYAWVVENRNPGTHVHWAVWVPEDRHQLFAEKVEVWFTKVAGLPWSDTAIKIGPVTDLRKLPLYMLKGVHRNRAAKLGVRHTSFQGVVFGKRGGVSESIGPTAIRRHRERAGTARLRVAN